MATKVSHEMATKLSLDTKSAQQGLKELTQEVKHSTAEWKTQEAQLKSSGDTLEASKVKYEGLGNTVAAQKQKIESLKSAMEQNNTSTKKGQELQEYLERQLASSTRELNSYQSQLERATQSYKYQESGLAKLNTELKQSNDLTKARVDRLEAEGRTEEASKAKLEGLSTQHAKYTDILKIQRAELDKLAESGDKSSSAYKKQELRVEQMGAKLAHTKSEIQSFNSTDVKPEVSGIATFRSHMEGLDSVIKQTKLHLGTVFVGNVLADGFRNATSFISGFAGEALNASDALDKFKSTMQLGGFGEKEIDSATKQVKKYADDTVYDLNTVSNTTAQLAANGVKDYIGLTEAAGNLNAQAGGNADTFKSVAMVLTQTAGAGKLTTENYNQLADAIPGASGVLQKALKDNKAYTGNFRDAMQNGQITADEFNTAITKLGMNDGAKKAATSTTTFEGAWGSLEANIVSGLDNIISKIGKKNLTGAINQMSDIATKAFGKLATVVANIVDYLAKNKGTLKDIFKNFTDIAGVIGGTVWKTFSGIVYSIADTFGLVGKKGKEAKDPLKKLDDILQNIANHREAIENTTKAIMAFMAVKKATEFISVLKGINAQLKIMEGFSSLSGLFTGKAGKGATAKVAGGTVGNVATEAVLTRAAGGGGTLKAGSLVSKMAPIASKVVAPLGAAIAGMDVAGSLIKAFSTHKASDAYKSAGKVGGTAIGAGIGGVLGSVVPGIGTVAGGLLGASIGDALGSTKSAESIAKKFHDAFKKHPLKAEYDVKPKKESTKNAYDDLNKSAKKYYSDKQKQDKKDLDLLLKNGYITKQQYDARLKAANDEAKKATRIEKLSQADRASVAKYYAQQKQDIETKSNQAKKTIASKWNKQIDRDEHIYGANSVQVRNDFAKKKKAIDDEESKKKKAVNRLTLKDATQTTVKEAKLHTTLAGKIQLSAQDQTKTLQRLTKEKGKLSDSQLKKISRNAKKEYDSVKDNADKQYKDVTKSNYNQAKKVIDAANRQYKSVKKAAEDQYDDTVEASKNQFKGNSQWAKDQRSAIEKQARQQRDNTIDAAGKQKDGVISKAGDQWRAADEKARKQHDDIVDKARKQKDDVTGEADKQRKNVEDKFQKQKEHTTRISKEQNNGILGGFTSFWNGMTGKSSDGMGWIARPINAGIKAINGIVASFGGSKNSINPLPTKYATGTGLFSTTRRPIVKPTLAMLNDGFDSPETNNKEMLIHPNGQSEIVEGQNTQRLLMPGTEVLNATETKLYHQMMGVKHFASGTGIFSKIWGAVKGAGSAVADVAGDVWDNMKDGVSKFTKMFSYITDAVAHPIKTLEKKFNPKRDGDNGSVFNNLADFVSFKPVKDQAGKWWSELWSMAKDSGEGGSGSTSELLNKAIKFGTGKPYVWGATGPDSFDCSGLVQYTLKQMGKSFPHYSGDQYNSSTAVSKPSVGDLVFFGGGGSQHVGIYSGGGKMFSAQSPDSHPNIGYAKISDWSESMAKGGYRKVPGLSTKDDTKEDKGGSSLQKLINSQVGGMFKWISKYIAPLNDDAGGSEGAPSGDGVGRWKSQVKQALEANGLSTSASMVNKVLRQINTESSGNEKAVQGIHDINSGGNEARGLMQTIPSTFNAYKHKGHGNIMNGYDNLLAALAYAKKTYGPSLSSLGNGHGYANGGLITKHQIAEIGEGNRPEMIIPLDGLKSSRGYELLGKTMSVMAARDNLASQSNTNSGLEKLESKFDSVIQLLGQLVQGQANPTPAYVIANQASQEINKVNNNGSRLTRNAMG